jgi:hypothetical protein
VGHRANFVVIRDGKASAYYDQWAALGAVYEFAAGAVHAARAAELSEPTPELMEWAFAEGGYQIDFDEKLAIVFGYPADFASDDLDDIPADEAAEAVAIDQALQVGPGEFLKVVADRWRSWTLQWDDRGVDAFAEHLARRAITSVAVQPPRVPAAGPPITLQVASEQS